MVSGSGDNTIYIWDVKSEKLNSTLQCSSWVHVVKQLSDGRLVSGADDKVISLWDIKTGHLSRVFEGHTSRVSDIIQLADGRIASAGSDDCTIRFWNL